MESLSEPTIARKFFKSTWGIATIIGWILLLAFFISAFWWVGAFNEWCNRLNPFSSGLITLMYVVLVVFLLFGPLCIDEFLKKN